MADAASADQNGSGQNHARYIGTVSIDYSALMHEQDRADVATRVQNSSGSIGINRQETEADASLFINSETKPFIGDRGAESGNPPIFYLRIAHYLLNAPNGELNSVRYYYSHQFDLRMESRLPFHRPNDIDGWHYSDYTASGGNGGFF